MMRYRNRNQEDLYHRYAKLGKEIAAYSTNGKEESIERAWRTVTEEGLWKLPVPVKDGGKGFSWDECITAIKGLVSVYHNLEFISLIVTQVSALYLLLQYGTEEHKSQYLHRLFQGETACIVFPKSIQKPSQHDYLILNYKNEIQNIANADIIIFAGYLGGSDVNFFVIDNQSKKIKLINTSDEIHEFLLNQININRDKFICSENSISALCDLINFIRLLYSILASKFMLPIIDQYKYKRDVKKKRIKMKNEALSRYYQLLQ